MQAMYPELENCIITEPGDHNEIYQLDLNISSIVFSHHSLFNLEQVLASRLFDIYESFQKRQQQNVTRLLSEKVRKCYVMLFVRKLNDLKAQPINGFRVPFRRY